jgi:biopolymer transport protein ExbD
MASHANDGDFGFQIAPMLDILFVLLLFFMVSAGVQKREAMITTPLPGQGPGPKVQVNLEITDEGQVLFNGALTDSIADHQLPQTVARLKSILVDNPDRPVIITPAPSTRQQRVVDVLNACTLVHVKNLGFGSQIE